MSISYTVNIVDALLATNVLTDPDYQTPGNFDIPEGFGIDCITSITVGGTNNNLTDIPSVSFSGSGGAVAHVILTGTSVASVVIDSPGRGYSGMAPLPTFTPANANGSGATAQSTLKAVIGNSSIVNPGDGIHHYAPGDIITLYGGTFITPAALTVNTVNGSGQVLTYTISISGSYTVTPMNPIITTTNGSGQGFTLNGDWGVNTITMIYNGSLYTARPNVNIPGGTAIAHSILTPTSVASITIDNGGSYTVGIPTVTLSFGNATAAATLGGPAINRLMCFVELMRSYISTIDSIYEAKLLMMVMGKMQAEIRTGAPVSFIPANMAINAQEVAMRYIFDHNRPINLDI